MRKRVFIIAEAGVNHNGSLELAKRLIDVAKEAGADAVKFQTFKAEKLASYFIGMAEYQRKNLGLSEKQLEMLKKLELSFEDFGNLKEYCEKKDIMFLSSPFDVESAKFLKTLGMNVFKIPSGEITDYPLLKEIGGYASKVIVSTGMADLGEIENALDVLAESGTKRENITVLHCNSEYPTPFEDVNLMAMVTIKEAFKVDVGYSDHTLGIEVPIAAVAIGAKVIEKHFTLDRNLPGPDHKASLEPDELKAMVKAIRNIEKALGNGIKKPSQSESKNISVVRKYIVAKRDIEKGEVFTEENLTTKRSSGGISAMRWREVLGKKAPKFFKRDEPIEIYCE